MRKENNMSSGQKKMLRANICSCGNIWFHEDMPESDPSYCPFCMREIETYESGEEYVDSYEDSDLMDDIEKEDANLIENEVKNITIMLECEFCKNTIYLSESSAKKVKCCPYCKGKLVVAGNRADGDVQKKKRENKLDACINLPCEVKLKTLFPKTVTGLYYIGYDPPPLDLLYFKKGAITEEIRCYKRSKVKEIVFVEHDEFKKQKEGEKE